MSKLLGNAYNGIVETGEAVKATLKNSKQDGKIASYEKQIEMLILEIGNLTVNELDGNKKVTSAIKERYSKIVELRELIAGADEAKKVTKVVCPHCGAKTVSDMKYCGTCGEKLD